VNCDARIYIILIKKITILHEHEILHDILHFTYNFTILHKPFFRFLFVIKLPELLPINSFVLHDVIIKK